MAPIPSRRHAQLVGMVFVVFGALVCLGAWRVIEDHASPLMVIIPASVMPVLVAALARKSRSR